MIAIPEPSSISRRTSVISAIYLGGKEGRKEGNHRCFVGSMDYRGRRKDAEWQSCAGGRGLLWSSSINAEVKGSKPRSTRPRPSFINPLTRSVDEGARANHHRSSDGGRGAGSSSTFLPLGISSRWMSMERGRADATAPNLAKNGSSADAGPKIARRNPGQQEDAAQRRGKPAGPDQAADSGAEQHKKFQARKDPEPDRRSAAGKLDLRKTVNVGARDGQGWQELVAKSGAEKSLLYLKKQMAELGLSSSSAREPRRDREEAVGLVPVVVERTSAGAVAQSVGVRIKAADMPSTMQIHAFRCARSAFDALTNFSSKQLAFALKKEFDKAYGFAWHCIVGTSFGSFVTHSAGGFLYFSIDAVAILLFKTAVERLE